MLGITADQLAAVYRTAFPVLYGYDTKRDYYDENGRLVPGDIVKKWLKDGDELNVEDRTATNESGTRTRMNRRSCCLIGRQICGRRTLTSQV